MQRELAPVQLEDGIPGALARFGLADDVRMGIFAGFRHPPGGNAVGFVAGKDSIPLNSRRAWPRDLFADAVPVGALDHQQATRPTFTRRRIGPSLGARAASTETVHFALLQMEYAGHARGRSGSTISPPGSLPNGFLSLRAARTGRRAIASRLGLQSASRRCARPRYRPGR